MILFGSLAGLSVALGVWQWAAAGRFPLHRRAAVPSTAPAITILKPLKGADAFTGRCLESWFQQDHPGAVQLLFGVASEEDPACAVVRRLIAAHPTADARLVICPENLGVNAKVSKLIQLQRHVAHPFIVVSDADVLVPPDLLTHAVSLMAEEETGMVSCPYQLANPRTVAMRWEAVAVNADFWSQVMQSNALKPMDFALGAVMLMRREALDAMGGFAAIANCLADDYQLGHRMVKAGWRSVLCPVVVECWDPPQSWMAVWKHQLRWARTIRVCQPAPYFFSILSNATLWPLLWVVALPLPWVRWTVAGLLVLRIALAVDLQARLTRGRGHLPWFWMVPVKDLLQVLVWLGAFLGNTIEWRGRRMRLQQDGTMSQLSI